MMELMNRNLDIPVILAVECRESTIDRQLIHFAVEAGALLTDGMGDGIWLINDPKKMKTIRLAEEPIWMRITITSF